MELGIAVSGYKEVIETAYNLPSLSKSVDFLSAMTYDYHGGWERTTAHHTPIEPSSTDPLAYYSIVSVLSICYWYEILIYINIIYKFKSDYV